MYQEPKKFYFLIYYDICFIRWSRTKPAISPRYACIAKKDLKSMNMFSGVCQKNSWNLGLSLDIKDTVITCEISCCGKDTPSKYLQNPASQKIAHVRARTHTHTHRFSDRETGWLRQSSPTLMTLSHSDDKFPKSFCCVRWIHSPTDSSRNRHMGQWKK